MYEEYFGLSGAPFKLNPDPKFFFGSRSHNKAMAYLHYGLKQAEGFIVITGPVGAGKSMVIGHLIDQLNASNIVAAQLLTSNVEPDELLSHILSAFRIEPEGEGRTGELEAFEDYLFDQLNRGRRVLLIMDEAQNLPRQTLEELRMLSNIDYDGTPLFQVFLIGQPEFRDTMASPEMEQLKQRVIASYHLENLTQEESREYILHRLAVVGWKEDPAFTDNAFEAIYAETGGRPRRINTLCNRLMLYCALEKQHKATGDIVRTVIAELHEEKLGAGEAAPEKDAAAQAKPVSMPPVRSVAKEESHEKKDDVVISIDDVRAKAQAPKPQPDEKKSVSTKTAADAASDSGSVFDRLRAKRATESDTAHPDERQEATLKDVATAIAAASVKDEDGDVNVSAADEPDETEPAGIAPSDKPADWNTAAAKSVNEARDELKAAHGSVQQLRRTLFDIEKRRRDRREKIAGGLSRAESLIGDIRKTWR